MIDRIAAAPVRPTAVLLGKSLSVFAYGVASLTTVLVFTSLFFGAYWGNPLSVGAISVAMIVAVVALTAFVIALARTDRQAEGLSSIFVFGLALHRRQLRVDLLRARGHAPAGALHSERLGSARLRRSHDGRARCRGRAAAGARDARVLGRRRGRCDAPRPPVGDPVTLLAIAGSRARRIVRDRISLFFLLVLPVLVIVIVGALVGGFGKFRVGVRRPRPRRALVVARRAAVAFERARRAHVLVGRYRQDGAAPRRDRDARRDPHRNGCPAARGQDGLHRRVRGAHELRPAGGGRGGLVGDRGPRRSGPGGDVCRCSERERRSRRV